MVDPVQDQNNLLDNIQPAEKPKSFFEAFFTKTFVLELEQKIRESLSSNGHENEDLNEIAEKRFEREKEYCKIILDGFEKFIKGKDPAKSFFLWDIQGTLGIPFERFVPRDSVEYLLGFIRSKYPELRFGVITDCHLKGIERILESPSMKHIGKYIDKDKYFSVSETDPISESEFENAKASGGVVVNGSITGEVVLNDGRKLISSISEPTHEYSELLHSLGSELSDEDRKKISKIDPQDRKKRIADLVSAKGINVFVVDDLPWAEKSGYGVQVPTMTYDFRLYN